MESTTHISQHSSALLAHRSAQRGAAIFLQAPPPKSTVFIAALTHRPAVNASTPHAGGRPAPWYRRCLQDARAKKLHGGYAAWLGAARRTAYPYWVCFGRDEVPGVSA